MPRGKDSTSSKRKDSPIKEDIEESKRAKVDDLEGKNLGNVVGGYKGALSNPHVSEEAKDHAEKMLDKLEPMVDASHKKADDHLAKHEGDGHIIGGYKATLSNPNVSEEAKEHAREVLEKHGIDAESSSRGQSDNLAKHEGDGHVIGGYKAAISNPNVSEEAKEHAREVLEKHGVDPSEKATNKHGKDIHHFISSYKSSYENKESSAEHKEHSRKMVEHLESHHKEGRHLGHVIGGYKAALSNPNVSDEAKEHARKMLVELDAEVDDIKHTHHVLGGYKATLSNPHASEEAKQHAQQVLDENDASSSTGRSSSHSQKDDSEKNPGNVIGGLKAALKNPNVSEEAKDDVRSRLDEAKVAY